MMAFYKQNVTAFLLLNKNFPRGQFRLANGGFFYCYFQIKFCSVNRAMLMPGHTVMIRANL